MRQLAAEATAAGEPEAGVGVEIGGILFGTADDYEVRIMAYRPIRCQHANGPEFLLSSDDEHALRAQIEKASSDPLLGGLVIVGWFHSHTRTPICLTAEDMRLWEIYFPMPWQVALVFRPQSGEPTRAGFFFRPAAGPVRTDSSYRVFEADAHAAEPEAATPAPKPAPVDEEISMRVEEAEPEPPAPTLDEPPPELLWQEPERSKRPVFLVAALALVAAAASFGVYRYRSAAIPQQAVEKAGAEPELVLKLIEENGQIKAIWNKESPVIARALRGSVAMGSGETTTELPLSPMDLGKGTLPILNPGRDVRVKMRIDTLDDASRPVQVELAAYYLGGDPVAFPTTTRPDASTSALSAEVALLESQLAAETAINDRLEAEVRLLDEEEASAAGPPETPVAKPEVAAVKPAPTTAATAPAQAPAAPQTPPPPPAAASQAPPAQATQTAPDPAVETPRPAPAPPPAPVYSGPRSGRIIWTGFLAPGATVTINGRSASAGTVNNALPGVPVRLSVYPAEFTSTGISVFSSNQRHASGDVSEGRSARNGWMNTRYVYDTDRARDAQLGAGPGEGDGYKRITLRGGSRPVAAVVIDWQVSE